MWLIQPAYTQEEKLHCKCFSCRRAIFGDCMCSEKLPPLSIVIFQNGKQVVRVRITTIVQFKTSQFKTLGKNLSCNVSHTPQRMYSRNSLLSVVGAYSALIAKGVKLLERRFWIWMTSSWALNGPCATSVSLWLLDYAILSWGHLITLISEFSMEDPPLILMWWIEYNY